jgi:hypothetical protein
MNNEPRAITLDCFDDAVILLTFMSSIFQSKNNTPSTKSPLFTEPPGKNAIDIITFCYLQAQKGNLLYVYRQTLLKQLQKNRKNDENNGYLYDYAPAMFSPPIYWGVT